MLTFKEKVELYARIEKATNDELGQICFITTGKNPFQNSLLLPSEIRKSVIFALKKFIREDKINVQKS